MIDPQARLEELIERLREGGHRITPQRLAILKILTASDGHPSAEQVHERIKGDFPTTSLATVYKTIATLKAMGEVLELGFADDSNRYDGNNPQPHPHLICVNCRNILDPEVGLAQNLIHEVAQSSGYQIVSHRLDFYGLCLDCQDSA
jgi:Fur family peroxide stress response transcriptional regulator